MINKIKLAIGGLAMIATTAMAESSVTNAPVLLAPQEIEYSTRDKITLLATNFNNGVAFNLYKSTNLVDWVKVPLTTPYSGVNPTNEVIKSYFESTPQFRKSSCYMLSTTNAPSFKK